MISDRWRREAAFGCGYGALYFAVRGASLAGFGAWFCCVVAGVLVVSASRLADG